MACKFWFSRAKLQIWLWFLLLLLMAAFVSPAQTRQFAEDSAPATVPAAMSDHPLSADSLVLAGTDGVEYQFDALIGGARAVCFAFLYPGCPLSREYAPSIDRLSKRFAEAGVRFVGVICENDTRSEIDEYCTEYSISFPIHLDTEFKLAKTLGASITPEVVLVDRERQIRYSGRIDDRYEVRGVMKLGDPEPELQTAIEDFLAGRVIGIPRTKAAGCPIDRPELPTSSQPSVKSSEAITYTKDVLPFLHKHCQICHAPGQAGPFNLLTYADAVEWIELAIEEMEARRMPPAQIESDFDYVGKKSPTPADLEMLKGWIAANKPEGDETDKPQLEPLPDYSAFQEDLGPPDIVIDLPEPTQLGAHGKDLYRNLVYNLNLPEDVRLRAIQFLPDNRRVVHHALIGYAPRAAVQEAVRNFGGREAFENEDDRVSGYWDPHGIGFRVPSPRDDEYPRSAFIGGFVPGVRAIAAPPNAVITIPAGCDVLAQMHYVRTGKLERDSSRMGLWLAREKPEKEMGVIYVAGEFGVIPAGVTDFHVRGSWLIRQDADLVCIMPHAHQMARWLEIRAYLPGTSDSKLVLRVPQWDYNWQSAYYLREPVRFPAGTRFEAECSYDNSSGNPRNPFDPPQNIWHGETINDEMLLPVMSFTSKKVLDGKSESFIKFWGSMRRSAFLRRMIEHRFKYVADGDGNVVLSPDYVDPE